MVLYVDEFHASRSLMRRMRASFPQQVPQYPIVPLKYPHTTQRHPDRTLKVPLQYPAVLPP